MGDGLGYLFEFLFLAFVLSIYRKEITAFTFYFYFFYGQLKFLMQQENLLQKGSLGVNRWDDNIVISKCFPFIFFSYH